MVICGGIWGGIWGGDIHKNTRVVNHPICVAGGGGERDMGGYGHAIDRCSRTVLVTAVVHDPDAPVVDRACSFCVGLLINSKIHQHVQAHAKHNTHFINRFSSFLEWKIYFNTLWTLIQQKGHNPPLDVDNISNRCGFEHVDGVIWLGGKTCVRNGNLIEILTTTVYKFLYQKHELLVNLCS